MPFGTLAIRPFNFLFRGGAHRAASPHTSSRGLTRLLADPTTRVAALKNALGREKLDPALALAVLAGNFSPESKAAVLRNVGENLDFTRVLPEAGDMTPYPLARCQNLLPKFFRLLAGQPDKVVALVHDFWSPSYPEPPAPADYAKGKAEFQFEKEAEYPMKCGAALLVRTYRSPLGQLPFSSSERFMMYDRDHHVLGCRIGGLVFYY